MLNFIQCKFPPLKMICVGAHLLLQLSVHHSSVWASVPCGGAFLTNVPSEASFPEVETNSYRSAMALESIREYRNQKFRKIVTEQRGEPYPSSKVDDAKHLAVQALIDEFGNDPVMAKLSKFEKEAAAQRILIWAPINDAELVSDVAAIEFERYRTVLHQSMIDPRAKPSSFNAMFRQFNVNYITHATSRENVLNILSQGKILKAADSKVRGMGGNKDYVYLEIPEKRIIREIDDPVLSARFYDHAVKEEGALFLFSPDILDTFHWKHINLSWNYGKYSPEVSIDASNMIAAFLNLYKNTDTYDPPLRFHPEIMLHEAIGLNGVNFKLLMRPKGQEQFLKDARAHGVREELLARIDWREPKLP